MSKTTELVERLRELPRDTRKATVEIYDLCIEASYEIEELTDRCARYAEEIAVLRGAVDAGYGEAPVTVERCRFTEMRLRVELLMTGGLRVGGEPVAVELEGVPEAAAGKED